MYIIKMIGAYSKIILAYLMGKQLSHRSAAQCIKSLLSLHMIAERGHT